MSEENQSQTDPTSAWGDTPPSLLPSQPLFSPLYRGAVKAPWAALAAAWRTAWLDITPVANSAWAFWKLASVCLYRLWTCRGGSRAHWHLIHTAIHHHIMAIVRVKMIPRTWYWGYSSGSLLSIDSSAADGSTGQSECEYLHRAGRQQLDNFAFTLLSHLFFQKKYDLPGHVTVFPAVYCQCVPLCFGLIGSIYRQNEH